MSSHPLATATTCLMIACTAGLALPARGQDSKAAGRNASEPLIDNEFSAYRFRSAESLIGAEVTNSTGEVIASVDDFIVDRGSGRIDFAVLSSGEFLGLGGKRFAVPYDLLWAGGAERGLMLDMTEEQIERQTGFLPEDWENLQHEDWMEQIEGWWEDDTTDEAAEARFRESVQNGEKREIEGVIQSVHRRSSMTDSEQVVVDIRKDDDHGFLEIALGPVWFVMGMEGAPMRGDEIEATIVPVKDAQGGVGRWVAIQAEIDDEQLRFRTADGEPAWLIDDARRDDDDWTGRRFLLSDLLGADTDIRGEDGGEVQDLLIEQLSGRVAMIAVDPNENFLGMADEIVLVPWTLARVDADNEVDIDATEDMLTRAERLPDDLTVLSAPARLAPVYRVYEIEVARFTPRPKNNDARAGDAAAGDAWNNRSSLIEKFRDGEKTELSGAVVDISNERVVDGAPEATLLRVQTGSGVTEVLLGPAWFMDRQGMNIDKGDRVVVHGRKAKIDGRALVAAWSIELDGEELAIWNGDNPTWDE